MKKKLLDLNNVPNVLKNLLEKDVPVYVLPRLREIRNEIIPYIDRIEEKRIELVKKYGSEDNEGGFTVTEENLEAFQQEFVSHITNTEVELEYTPISVLELGDVHITLKDFEILEQAGILSE